MSKQIEHWALNLINVDLSLIVTCSQLNKQEKLQAVREHLRTNYANHMHIFTDGAKNIHTGHTGIGIFDIANNTQYKAKLNNHIDINSVELAAASYSSKYINTYLIDSHSLIISDSLHTCKKLKNYSDTEQRLDLIHAIHRFAHNIMINGGSLTILWVPSHIDLPGHDKADKLAKEGMQSNIYHDINYSINELKSRIEVKYSTPTLQKYWEESRTGTDGRRIVPLFSNKININNFTNNNSNTQLLIRMIFGTARFHITRNRACPECNANLSIEHTILHCRIFENQRERIRQNLNRLNLAVNLENILKPQCHLSIRQHRNNLIQEINNRFEI